MNRAFLRKLAQRAEQIEVPLPADELSMALETRWPYVRKDLLAARRFEVRERMPGKRTYSFTGDLRIYETCPRQYQFFREYDFTPSRSAVIFFGLLVHRTIEEIHRIALDGRLDTLDEPRIQEIFDRTFRLLVASDVRPIGDRARDAALAQVLSYFRQNGDEMQRVQFRVTTPPEAANCKECDLRMLCHAEGIISRGAAEA